MAFRTIKLRRDTATNWNAEDPILAQGEPGWDLTNLELRVGDGTSTWSELTPISGGGSGTMSAAEILAALVTVDGAGSGLDADTLDGTSSAGFAAAGHNHTGTYEPAGTAAAAVAAEAALRAAGDVNTSMRLAYGAVAGVPNQPWKGEPGLGPNLWLSPISGGGRNTASTVVLNAPSQTIVTRMDLQTAGHTVGYPDDNAVRILFTLTLTGTPTSVRRLWAHLTDASGTVLGAPTYHVLWQEDAYTDPTGVFHQMYELDTQVANARYLEITMQSGASFSGGTVTLSGVDIRRIARRMRTLNVGWSNPGGWWASGSALEFLAVDVPIDKADGTTWRIRKKFAMDGITAVTKVGAESWLDVAGSSGYSLPIPNSGFSSSALGKLTLLGGTVANTEHVNNHDSIIEMMIGGSPAFLGNVHGGEVGRSGSYITASVATAPSAGTSETWTVKESAPFTVGQTYDIDYERITVTAKPTSTTITVTRGTTGTIAIQTHASGAPLTQPSTDNTVQYDRGDGVWLDFRNGDTGYYHQCRRVKITNATKIYRSDQSTPFCNIDRTWTVFADGTERCDRTVTFISTQDIIRWYYWMSTLDTSSTALRVARCGRGTQVLKTVDWRTKAAIPATPTSSTATTGGTLAAATYSYRVAALTAFGETPASTAKTQATTGSTSTVTVGWSSVTGATAYRIYGRTAGAEALLATVTGTATSWVDDGSTFPTTPPAFENTAVIPATPLDGQVDSNHAEWDAVYNQATGLAYGMAIDRTAILQLNQAQSVRCRLLRSGSGLQKIYHLLDMGSTTDDFPVTIASGTVFTSTQWAFYYAPADPKNFHLETASRGAAASVLSDMYPVT